MADEPEQYADLDLPIRITSIPEAAENCDYLEQRFIREWTEQETAFCELTKLARVLVEKLSQDKTDQTALLLQCLQMTLSLVELSRATRDGVLRSLRATSVLARLLRE